MMASAWSQTSLGSTRLTVPRAVDALEAFSRDAAAFLGEHPLVLGATVGVGIVFFHITRPKVH